MLAHDGIRVVAARGESGGSVGGWRCIAERYRKVPQPSSKSKTAKRAALALREVLLLGPAEELDEVRGVEAVPDAEVRLGRDPRELVPGANELAIVAAEDPVADRWTERLGNRPMVLDRQVGNAAACVELIGRSDRTRRAGGHAGAAASAAVRRARVDRERKVRKQFAEHEE